jgi:hypothetical protein
MPAKRPINGHYNAPPNELEMHQVAHEYQTVDQAADKSF